MVLSSMGEEGLVMLEANPPRNSLSTWKGKQAATSGHFRGVGRAGTHAQMVSSFPSNCVFSVYSH